MFSSMFRQRKVLLRSLHIEASVKAASRSIIDGLSQDPGIAIIPNFFQSSNSISNSNDELSNVEPHICTQLRQEATNFYNNGQFRISQSTRFINNNSVPPEVEYYDKENVYSMAVHYPEYSNEAQQLQKYCNEMAESIVPLINQHFVGKIKLDNPAEKTHVVNKLAVVTGNGGGYEPHIDGHGEGDTRKLTVILYLNPNWTLENGGQFRVHNPMSDPTVSPLIDPIADTLVLFWSDQLLHSTLPSFSKGGDNEHRYALTLWLTGV